MSHLQGGFLLGRDVLLLGVVPELLQTRPGQRDAAGREAETGFGLCIRTWVELYTGKLELCSVALHRPSLPGSRCVHGLTLHQPSPLLLQLGQDCHPGLVWEGWMERKQRE